LVAGHFYVGGFIVTTLEMLERLQREAFSGALGKADATTLEEYAAALCHSQAFTVFGERQFAQVSETVRVHLLRAHIESLQDHVGELHDHITNLNGSNTKLQKLVVVLTVASLIGTAAQVWFAAKADKSPEEKSPTTASQLQTPTAQSAAPNQAVAPAAGPAKKKAP
jgi:hypothetical protein